MTRRTGETLLSLLLVTLLFTIIIPGTMGLLIQLANQSVR